MRAFQKMVLAAVFSFGFASTTLAQEFGFSPDDQAGESQAPSMPPQHPGMQPPPPMGGLRGPGHFKPHNPCAELKLDVTQKDQIKSAIEQSKKDAETLRANVKTATDNFVKTVTASDSSLDSATTASQALNEAQDAVRDAEQTRQLTILYNILKPEQRELGLKCLTQPLLPPPTGR